MAPQKKNLMEHYDDGNLDLSMSGIQDVPVRDIAAIPKATSLDLSCNTIITLPKSFASSLTRLVKLDLSKNQITNLPDNFGLLINLKHLDLYSNKIESLPLSFGNLKALRWLDLKVNPLMPKLAQIAGLCLDAQQCQAAAKNVVTALRATQEVVNTEISRLKEEQLKKTEEEEEIAKLLNKENKAQKKKKKKAAHTIHDDLKKANGDTQFSQGDNCEINSLEGKDPQKNTAGKDNVDENPGFLKKVGRFLRGVFKFVVMTTLLVVFCGFMLSLLDEDLYNSTKKKAGLFIQSNVPKPYLKKWSSGMLLAQRTVENWSAQTIAISVHGYNKAHEYFVTISNDETVQQYLESVKSGWHIFWIWVSEAYVSMSTEVPRYFDSLRQLVFDSSTNKS